MIPILIIYLKYQFEIKKTLRTVRCVLMMYGTNDVLYGTQDVYSMSSNYEQSSYSNQGLTNTCPLNFGLGLVPERVPDMIV